MTARPGPKNLITDVAGLRVGQAEDHKLRSGVTVVLCDEPAIAGYEVDGRPRRAPAETDLLNPHNMVDCVHALVLSGGSAFGLDARLRHRRPGCVNRASACRCAATSCRSCQPRSCSIWSMAATRTGRRYPPLPANSATRRPPQPLLDFVLGTAGAGTGALSAGLKGGLGSASLRLPSGITIGALAAVNPAGSVTVGRTPAISGPPPFEIGDEFGGRGPALALPPADAHHPALEMAGPLECRAPTQPSPSSPPTRN